ncbi:hypothetical protein LCGC14_0731920 [marine sediment metagenome]|uniref:Uncharacterized protein n=1 Tax=marine sediment metagenome TaxID=412755 RepID=A0A0F9SUE4_9ZZZZ
MKFNYWFKNLLISLGITILMVALSSVGKLIFEFSNLNAVFLNFLIWILLNQFDQVPNKKKGENNGK